MPIDPFDPTLFLSPNVTSFAQPAHRCTQFSLFIFLFPDRLVFPLPLFFSLSPTSKHTYKNTHTDIHSKSLYPPTNGSPYPTISSAPHYLLANSSSICPWSRMLCNRSIHPQNGLQHGLCHQRRIHTLHPRRVRWHKLQLLHSIQPILFPRPNAQLEHFIPSLERDDRRRSHPRRSFHSGPYNVHLASEPEQQRSEQCDSVGNGKPPHIRSELQIRHEVVGRITDPPATGTRSTPILSGCC
jgi:hypothetical protein